ncbi:YrvL family regulatory protein [Pullulanibacillus sp. KACC 23026]|uniref:YrvL family regulatory protein n=1 Tax=Pullulanibacillus sp. KACC 23026 TaxID=3028315 RepID=UPI0023B10598|nr:YrvL family regulatory protein [Pullulanibacillus sp. KACC 23026]WEG12428.1 YrvL family regulatory protein [Pullulanibacillus sp. KACC 23026]
MSQDNDKLPVDRMNLLEKIIVVIGIIVLIILSITVIIGIIILGETGFFKLFGVNYTSLYALIRFIIFFFVLDFIFDLVTTPIIKFLITGKFFLIKRMIIDGIFTWLALYVADSLMTNITISYKTEIIAVILFVFIEVAIGNKVKIYKGK